MSIQSEINRIIGFRDASLQAVAAKGVTVPTGSAIDDLPSLIAQIPTGGGTSLNFTVVGGTTRPSSPAENTIWVDTDETITGVTMSAVSPSALADGEVWIRLMDSGSASVSVISGASIIVKAGTVVQNVSGVLVGRNAQIYQDGVWADMVGWAYYHGEKFTTFTGGYTFTKNSNGAYADKSADGGYMYLYDNGSSNARFATVYSVNQISDMRFSRLHAKVIPKRTNTGSIRIAATTQKTVTTNIEGLSSTLAIAKFEVFDANVEMEISVDVSNIGSYYIAIQAQGGSRPEIYEIWFT